MIIHYGYIPKIRKKQNQKLKEFRTECGLVFQGKNYQEDIFPHCTIVAQYVTCEECKKSEKWADKLGKEMSHRLLKESE